MDDIKKITVQLPIELAEYVRERVDAGAYESASDMICEALREWSGTLATEKTEYTRIIEEIDAAAASPVRLSDDEVTRLLEERHRHGRGAA